MDTELLNKNKQIAFSIIQPETDIETRIINDISFLQGISFGKPRKGHPEGIIIEHIKEVLKNVDKYSENDLERKKLRLIGIIHDSFKYLVKKSVPKSKNNDHAVFARKFAEKYIVDSELLNIIELHDEAHNAWIGGSNSLEWLIAYNRADFLINQLGLSINLYLKFFLCDTETGDKSNASYLWFKKIIKKHLNEKSK